MKRFLLFCGVVAVGVAAASAQVSDVRFVNLGDKCEASVNYRQQVRQNLQRAAAVQLWKPATVTE